MTMAKQRILVVDDEETLCEILKFNLEVEGYSVDTANSAEEALTMSITDYALIMLDVMMGEMSGFEMAQKLKDSPKTALVPIIFCTAKETEEDTVAGLTLGADDYISKPFSVREVVARVKSVLRRASTSSTATSQQEVVSYKGLVIDLKRKSCSVDGKVMQLTKKELEILTLFLQNRDVVFSRAEILSRIWSDDVIVVDRTIDVKITRLRKKMGEYGKHIVTRLGYGYGFEEQ